MFYLLVNVVMAVLATAWVCFLPLDWVAKSIIICIIIIMNIQALIVFCLENHIKKLEAGFVKYGN